MIERCGFCLHDFECDSYGCARVSISVDVGDKYNTYNACFGCMEKILKVFVKGARK